MENRKIKPDWCGTFMGVTYEIFTDELHIVPIEKPFTIDLLPILLNKIFKDCSLAILEDIKVIYIDEE